jgi:L-alanine-DL-glutamate epimerase-like enolase superfamily enzyme
MIEWRHFDLEAQPLEAQPYGGVLAPQRGRISMPQGPGVGIDPNPGVTHAYSRESEQIRCRSACVGPGVM